MVGVQDAEGLAVVEGDGGLAAAAAVGGEGTLAGGDVA